MVETYPMQVVPPACTEGTSVKTSAAVKRPVITIKFSDTKDMTTPWK